MRASETFPVGRRGGLDSCGAAQQGVVGVNCVEGGPAFRIAQCGQKGVENTLDVGTVHETADSNRSLRGRPFQMDIYCRRPLLAVTPFSVM